MTGPEHRWHSFYDRNRALAVADYVARVRHAAGATAEVGGHGPVSQVCRDLGALGAALGAVLALHTSRPPSARTGPPLDLSPAGVVARYRRPGLARAGGGCRACTSMLRHAGWPCATHRVIARALDAWHVLP